MKKVLAWVGMGVALFLGSMQAASAGEAFPRVVVVIPAITPYVDALLSGIGHAENLLRPGQDAHSFAMTNRQRQALDDADVIIIADRAMTPYLNKLLDMEAKRGTRIVALTELPGAEALPYETENAWLEAVKKKAEAKTKKTEHADHEEEDEPTTDAKGKPLTDPHLWLDPIRMAALAKPLAEAIGEKAPNHRTSLLSNAKTLSQHLQQEVDPALRTILSRRLPHTQISSQPEVPFITFHAGYQYFLKRYDMHNPGEITQRPEELIGAQSLHAVMESAEHTRIRCIISEADTSLVKHIAKASSAKVIALSPEAPIASTAVSDAPWVQNDYDRLLQKTAESFASCL